MVIKGVKYIAVAVFVIAMAFCYVKVKDCVYMKLCGDSLPLKISYNGSYGNNGPFPNPTVQLLSILKYNDGSRLLFRLEDGRIGGQIRQYISYDHGTTLQNVDWPLLGQSDVKSTYGTRMVSHVDDRILYECYSVCKEGFPVSTDGGKTWTHVNPKLSNGDVIYAIQFMDTGMHLASRVYARIWTNVKNERIIPRAFDHIPNNYDFQIGVSDDCGRHFSLLPEGILKITESRNSPLVRYGLILSSHLNVSSKRELGVLKEECLAISMNEGKSWKIMEGGMEIIGQKLYENRAESDARGVWTWKKYPSDLEYPFMNIPIQIESDPNHPGNIYILTNMGLYISRNTGKTFRFINLTDGWLNTVDRIAVDPQDGRYLYATVRMGKFYRSSDYGCTWEFMSLPQ